jgi:hypothetical protein
MRSYKIKKHSTPNSGLSSRATNKKSVVAVEIWLAGGAAVPFAEGCVGIGHEKRGSIV